MVPQKPGFVVGLAAEARLLAGFMVRIGGGDPAGAARAAAALLADGATALVSFGFAGGLAPDLPAGRIVVPEQILVGEDPYPCDPSLLAWLGGVTVPRLLAGREIATDPAQKSALHRRTGAAAIDLESGAVAQAAAARGVPMAALRAISDPADRHLPPAALVQLKPDGTVNLPGVLASLARRPGQLPALLRLARDTGRARAALAERARTLTLRIGRP